MDDDSSLSELDEVRSTRPSVSSLLGVKGPLRFRPHRLNQKPHVVLRRVDLSPDSSDEDQDSGVVCFALFSQKRIQIQAGKEILFSIASSDGKFKDQSVLFEGDLLDEEEDVTQVAEEEEAVLPPKEAIMPPKMRRAWTRKVDDVSPATSKYRILLSAFILSTSAMLDVPAPSPQTRSDVGVQAQPPCASVSTQTQKQATPARVSSCTQTDKPQSVMSVLHKPDPRHPTAMKSSTTAPKRPTAQPAIKTSAPTTVSKPPIVQSTVKTPLPPLIIVSQDFSELDASFKLFQPAKPARIPSPIVIDSPSDEPTASKATPPSPTSEDMELSPLDSDPVIFEPVPSSSKSILPSQLPKTNGGESVITSNKSKPVNPFVSAGYVTNFLGSAPEVNASPNVSKVIAGPSTPAANKNQSNASILYPPRSLPRFKKYDKREGAKPAQSQVNASVISSRAQEKALEKPMPKSPQLIIKPEPLPDPILAPVASISNPLAIAPSSGLVLDNVPFKSTPKQQTKKLIGRGWSAAKTSTSKQPAPPPPDKPPPPLPDGTVPSSSPAPQAAARSKWKRINTVAPAVNLLQALATPVVKKEPESDSQILASLANAKPSVPAIAGPSTSSRHTIAGM